MYARTAEQQNASGTLELTSLMGILRSYHLTTPRRRDIRNIKPVYVSVESNKHCFCEDLFVFICVYLVCFCFMLHSCIIVSTVG